MNIKDWGAGHRDNRQGEWQSSKSAFQTDLSAVSLFYQRNRGVRNII